MTRKRHDTRLLYICKSKFCPYKLSVRLPTWTCDRGCTYCCRGQWLGNQRYAQKYHLSPDKFIELWTRIFINNDWRWVYPLKRITDLWNSTRTLRYVREDLFCKPVSAIRKLVLNTHIIKNIGMICKTSSLIVHKHAYELRKFPHCIVMNCSPMADDYQERVIAICEAVYAGLNITAAIQPIIAVDNRLQYILKTLPKGINGVMAALYRGPFIKSHPEAFLKEYKRIKSERQYTSASTMHIYQTILRACRRQQWRFGTYYSSPYHIFNDTEACCCADQSIIRTP